MAAMDIPVEKSAIRDALLDARQYTSALYADLSADYWIPSRFPYSAVINPPLWEVAHIAWFAEFFCVRWTSHDTKGALTPSIWQAADGLLDSSRVEHRQRWSNAYPDRDFVQRYMADALDRVLTTLTKAPPERISLFQLALLHEHMHAEALAMTLRELDLPLPVAAPHRQPLPHQADDGQ